MYFYLYNGVTLTQGLPIGIYLHMSHQLATIENVNVIDQRRSKLVRTVLSIAIDLATGEIGQSKTLFLSSFNPLSSIIKSVYYYRLCGVYMSGILELKIMHFNLIIKMLAYMNKTQIPQ